MSKKIRLTDGTKLTLKELAAPDVSGSPRVITLLKEKKLNPEDVQEELLMLTDSSGISVLDVCIERFHEPFLDVHERLNKQDADIGQDYQRRCNRMSYFAVSSTLLFSEGESEPHTQ